MFNDNFGGFSQNLQSAGFSGVRAVENPLDNLQLIQPVVTELVLGTPVETVMPGSIILPRIIVGSWAFKYVKYGIEHLQEHNAERALRAAIQHSDFMISEETGRLRRFSWATLRDTDELTNAAPVLSIREKAAGFAKRIVDMTIERKKRNLLVNPASYGAGHTLALSNIDSWVSPAADSRADVRSIMDAIGSKLGLGWDQLTVGLLSNDSLQAALSDQKFLAARTGYAGATDTPDTNDLRKYWGCRKVWAGNPREADPANPGFTKPMYADDGIAVVYYDGENQARDFDTEYGEHVFGVTFGWNRGVASTPFFDDRTTSFWFPWNDYAEPKITNAFAGGLITGVAAR